jgi:hypothetical protein
MAAAAPAPCFVTGMLSGSDNCNPQQHHIVMQREDSLQERVQHTAAAC